MYRYYVSIGTIINPFRNPAIRPRLSDLVRTACRASPSPHTKPGSPRFFAMASAVSKRLAGKTVLITGASSGIGRSTAFEFARTSPGNLKLILTARRIDALEKVAADINKEVGGGVQVLPVQLDVSNPDAVRAFHGGLPAEFKQVDILVNNA